MIKCKAVIFDLDGTLVDSSECIEKVWKLWCTENNVDYDKLLPVSLGRPALDTMREFLPEAGPEMSDWFFEHEIRETGDLKPILGATEFISKLPFEKWSVATSGVYELASSRLESAGLPLPVVFVTADRVKKAKPDPESFLKAAEELGYKPEECVVFEDSRAGVEAAVKAGMKLVGVRTSLDNIPEADIQISSYKELLVNYLGNGIIEIKQIKKN